jgi:hypothetical protein
MHTQLTTKIGFLRNLHGKYLYPQDFRCRNEYNISIGLLIITKQKNHDCEIPRLIAMMKGSPSDLAAYIIREFIQPHQTHHRTPLNP